MNLTKILRDRQFGYKRPVQVKQIIWDHQFSDLQLSQTVAFNQESHTASVSSIALDSDVGRYLLAGLGDGTLLIHLIRGETSGKGYGYQSKVEWRAGKTHQGRHKHGIKTVSWFSDNGIFLTSGRDGKLKAWDTNAGSVVEEFNIEEGINHHKLADPSIGALIAVASKSRNVVLADLQTGSSCHTLRGHKGEVYALAWNPANAAILATGSADKKVMLWDVRQGKSFLATLDYNNVRYKRSKDLKLSGESHQGGVHGLQFSTCGKYLYSLGSDKRIRKWDSKSMKNLKVKFPEVDSKHDGHTEMAVVDEGFEDLLFVPEQHNISVFHARTGAALQPLVGHFSSVYTLAHSSADTVLYSGGRDRFILQWDPPLSIAAALASKTEESTKEESSKLTQYTVDTWSSDEENDDDS
eukprot:TRINITY_DN2057_c0_g1_i1.p1 TRINITY_DN2057_c0_g1~~TRINITY_DN2057_c0_g1_i1.p1  ORF type:complete len:410 (+),score=71.74 TRINITY_DN2057_c0_g1_i1:104-1333(+)